MPSTTFRLTMFMLPLQVSLLWHFGMFIFGNMAPWMATVYEFSNTLMLLAGAWATIDRQNAGAALFFFVAIIINLLHEIVLFGLYFDDTHWTSRYKFSAGMAIINHITKYVTLLFVFQHFLSRGGSLRDTLGSVSEYEPIAGSVTTDGGHHGEHSGHAEGYPRYTDDSGQS